MNYKQHRLFEKIAVNIHRIGKTKAYLLGGKNVDSFLLDKALDQPLVKKVINYAKKRGRGDDIYHSFSDVLAGGARIGGTISKGKAYIRGRTGTARGKISTREKINHELFHLKPIVGHFETFAHIAGGLKRDKGKISIPGAIKSYGYAWKTRPVRIGIEHGILGGTGIGIGSGIKNMINREKDDKNNHGENKT